MIWQVTLAHPVLQGKTERVRSPAARAAIRWAEERNSGTEWVVISCVLMPDDPELALVPTIGRSASS